MPQMNVFVSVAGTANERQENFVHAVEERLRSEGLVPHTVGRNTFSADAPLKAVSQVMADCAGVVVIALERSYFPAGLWKRGGPKESPLTEIKLATPWNHIEAAMGYSRGLPLLVLVEREVQGEGFLEKGYDWHVQKIDVDAQSLTSTEFNGVLASWKTKMTQAPPPKAASRGPDPAQMTMAELLGALKPAQLWSLVGTVGAAVAGAFALGAKLFG